MRQIALMTLAVAIGATAACQSSDQKQAEDAAKQAATAIEQAAKGTESGAAQAAKGLEQMAKDANGSLVQLDKWGVRRFSHEIRKVREGFYVVAEFTAPNALTELDRTMRLADEVIRHKFLRLPLDEAHRRGMAGATA